MSFPRLCSSMRTRVIGVRQNYARFTSVSVSLRHFSSIRITRTSSSPKYSKFIKVSPEVEDALSRGAPVVAFESATITNPKQTGGIPYPGNLEYAARIEDEVRKMGVVPVTITVVAGFVHIGAIDADLYRRLMAREPMKVTQRDLPYIIGMPTKWSGGLTVSATISIAEMVGIKVMATGGIGGVHRSATTLMDISSDVHELGRKNVAVVCSGPKVYLDSLATIEYLETRGVPVATFGPGSMEVMVPTFYSRDGVTQSPLVLQTAKDAAKVIYASHNLGLKCGQLFCNPISSVSSLNIQTVEKSVHTYFKQRKKKNKKDKEVVSDIISLVRQFSREQAVPAEKTLLLSNARKAAEIAIELSKLESSELEPKFGDRWSDIRGASQVSYQPSRLGIRRTVDHGQEIVIDCGKRYW